MQDLSYYINGIKERNIAILSRAITLIESTNKEHKQLAAQLIDKIIPLTGNSVRVGITGIPGVGKSTFIESFGMFLIGLDKRVAVLAIDPSSSLSKGSILGDKTRMEQLSVQENAFIRPTASSGSLGGLAYKTREVALLCEAAGFDYIIIETVGVGQSETEVSHITDFFLLMMLAGAGDELQGIKRGIMEMADGIVIAKADGENLANAKVARTEYARALHFLQAPISGWHPEVTLISAYENLGISEVYEMIEQFLLLNKTKGTFELKRKNQNLMTFQYLLNDKIRQLVFEKLGLQSKVIELEQQIKNDEINPYAAINKISLS